MDASETRLVWLKGDLVMPVEPWLLALELEERGFNLSRMPDGVLSVQPYERLTRDDYQRIRRWKLHLLSLVDYEPEPVQ